jgi:hypothetical protein
MMRLRIVLRSIFFLLGTFLHELIHFVVALCLGKAEGFSVRPRIEGDTVIFGSVRSKVRYKVLSSFIAIAPLLWWVILLLILQHLCVLRISGRVPRIRAAAVLRMLKHFSLSDVFSLWLFVQMFWAGTLSVTDIKNFFGGIFSLSGVLLISAALVLVYCSRHFL